MCIRDRPRLGSAFFRWRLEADHRVGSAGAARGIAVITGDSAGCLVPGLAVAPPWGHRLLVMSIS
eukprot:802170-Alexandrium_andersonii.AAC.1